MGLIQFEPPVAKETKRLAFHNCVPGAQFQHGYFPPKLYFVVFIKDFRLQSC